MGKRSIVTLYNLVPEWRTYDLVYVNDVVMTIEPDSYEDELRVE